MVETCYLPTKPHWLSSRTAFGSEKSHGELGELQGLPVLHRLMFGMWVPHVSLRANPKWHDHHLPPVAPATFRVILGIWLKSASIMACLIPKIARFHHQRPWPKTVNDGDGEYSVVFFVENGEQVRLWSTVSHDSAICQPGGLAQTSWAYQQKSNISKLQARRHQGYEPSGGYLFGLPHELPLATWYFEDFPRHSAELKESWYHRAEIPPWLKSHADASPFWEFWYPHQLAAWRCMHATLHTINETGVFSPILQFASIHGLPWPSCCKGLNHWRYWLPRRKPQVQ